MLNKVIIRNQKNDINIINNINSLIITDNTITQSELIITSPDPNINKSTVNIKSIASLLSNKSLATEVIQQNKTQVIVSTGVGNIWDKLFLLTTLNNSIGLPQFTNEVQTDINAVQELITKIQLLPAPPAKLFDEVMLASTDGVNLLTSAKNYTDQEINNLTSTFQNINQQIQNNTLYANNIKITADNALQKALDNKDLIDLNIQSIDDINQTLLNNSNTLNSIVKTGGSLDSLQTQINQTSDKIDFNIQSIETLNGKTESLTTELSITNGKIESSVIDINENTNLINSANQTITALGITSSVQQSTLDGLTLPGGTISQIQSTINQQADLIEANVQSISTVNGQTIKNASDLSLTNTNIEAYVEQLNQATGDIDSAKIELTATSAATIIIHNKVKALEVMTADHWGVNITDDVNGNPYITGINLILHPAWEETHTYNIDDYVYGMDNNNNAHIYKCILGHTATQDNSPNGTEGVTYWVEEDSGYRSEFTIQADAFKMYSTNTATVFPLLTLDNTQLLLNSNIALRSDNFGSPTEAWYNLDPSTGIAQFHNIDLTLTAAGKSALQNTLNVMDGADVTADSDFVKYTYPNDIANIQNQIDGNITTWFYAEEPTLNNLPASNWTTTIDKDNHLGDLYYDENTGYAYRFTVNSGTYSWQKISDVDITNALAVASNAQDTADHKRRVFVDTPYPPYDVGDLWSEGEDGDIKKCITAKVLGEAYSSADWELASKYDKTAESEFVTITYPNNLTNIQNQIDGKIISWFQSIDPSLTWEGTDLQHNGDMWWNTNTKQLKRYDGSTWSAPLTDQTAIDAYANAATAQDTADNKRRVFTDTPYPPYDVGDLWAEGQDGDLHKCKTARQTGNYVSTDWELAAKYDQTPGFPSDTNLVGYWALDEGSGDKAVDSSGNNNIGTLVGNPTWVNNGVSGKCLNFDRIDDYIICGQCLPVNNTTPFSFCAWVKPNSLSGWYTIIGTQGSYWEITINNGQVKIGGNANHTSWVIGSTLSAGVWSFITGTYDGIKARIYVNGCLVGGPTILSNTGGNNGVNIIGAYKNTGGELFDGFIDEVRIYNTALTDTEIKALYLNPGGNKSTIATDTMFVNNILASDLIDQIDGKIISWFQDTDPSLTWTGTNLQHNGDMWYKESEKKLYRYDANTNTWKEVQNQKAIDAYDKASTAQDTADGKRRVFTNTPYPPYDVGDLWSEGENGDLQVCIIPKSAGQDYNSADWALASMYDKTSVVLNDYGFTVGDFGAGSGWNINGKGLFSYTISTPLHGFATDNNTSWQHFSNISDISPIDPNFIMDDGDFILGGYNYKEDSTGKELGGVFWDQTTKQLYIKGAIKQAVIGDLANGTGWLINNTGLYSYTYNTPLHGFAINNSIPWQQTSAIPDISPIDLNFSINDGDFVLGGYNYKEDSTGLSLGGIFWDQTAKQLHVRGAIVNDSNINWGNITGSSKPEDNATLGATWGTNINNIPINIFTGGNLINPADEWIPDTYGSQGHFNAISGNESKVISTSVGIFGTTESVWECIPGSTSNADGGWTNNFITVEANKTYIFGVYVWKLNNNGSFYLGCGTTTTENLDGSSNGNPYFINGNLSEYTGKWLLVIGVLHPAGYTGGDTGLSGIYDIETGIKIKDGTEFRLKNGVTNQTHRCFHYYNTAGDNATVFQKMARPFVVPSDKFPGIQALTIKLDNIAPNATKGATWGIDISNQPDHLYQTFYQSSAPTSGIDIGDYWIDTDDNTLHRYNGSSWETIQDVYIQTALTTATEKIKTYFQSSAPTGMVADDEGDIWFDTDDNNKPYRYNGSSWVAAPQDTADWTKIYGTNKPADNADVTQTVLNNYGFIVGNFNVGSGWNINGKGLFSYTYSTSLHGFATDNSVPWQQVSTISNISPIDPNFTIDNGDFVLGGYNYKEDSSGLNLGGIFWDQSAKQLHVKGAIINDSNINWGNITGSSKPEDNADVTATVILSDTLTKSAGDIIVSNTGSIQIQTETVGKGLIVGDFGNGNGWQLNNNGLFSYILENSLHAFAITDNNPWQQASNISGISPINTGFILDAGDIILGTYNYKLDSSGQGLGGIFWDQSAKQLTIRGAIVEESNIDYGNVTGNKPPSDADKTSLNTAAGIAGQGTLATLNSVNYDSQVSGTKPPSDANNTQSTFASTALTKNSGDITINNGADIIMNGNGFDTSVIQFHPTSDISTHSYINATIYNSNPYLQLFPQESGGVLSFGDDSISQHWDYIGGTANQKVVFKAQNAHFEMDAVMGAMLNCHLRFEDNLHYLSKSGDNLYWHDGTSDILLNNDNSSVAWDDITDKPSTFPPSAHTHSEYASTNDSRFLTTTQKSSLTGSNVCYLHYHTYLAYNGNILLSGDTGGVYCYYNFAPLAKNQRSLGLSDRYWYATYTNYIYYKTREVLTLDDIDDLAHIEKFKPLLDEQTKKPIKSQGRQLLDIKEVPDLYTNKEKLIKEFKEESNGQEDLTVEDLNNILQDKNTKKTAITKEIIANRLFLDASKINSLSIGAIKQLNNEVTTDVMEQLNSLIEDLTERITKLEQQIN